MTEDPSQKSLQEHIRSETQKNFVINLILNAGIAYAVFHSFTQISAWGDNGYGRDLFLTGFLLAALLGGIFIALHRRKRDRQEILLQGNEGQALARLMPYNPWLAGIWFGVLGAAVAAPLLLGLLALLDVHMLTPALYATIKGFWAGALAAVVVPTAIRQGLRAAPNQG